jgi:hypothetical protein
LAAVIATGFIIGWCLFPARQKSRIVDPVPIAGPSLTSPLDRPIGPVGKMFNTASTFWAYYLVDVWLIGSPMNSSGLSHAARSDANDLLRRLDRDVSRQILAGREPRLTTPADDLAAGIIWWTLQWRAGELGAGDAAAYQQRAQGTLLRASHEGDSVQRSFASLAYAYSALRLPELKHWSFNDRDKASPLAAWHLSQKDARTEVGVYMARLRSVYLQFFRSVPQRALRAAYEVMDDCYRANRPTEGNEWRLQIIAEFPSFLGWGCRDVGDL